MLESSLARKAPARVGRAGGEDPAVSVGSLSAGTMASSPCAAVCAGLRGAFESPPDVGGLARGGAGEAAFALGAGAERGLCEPRKLDAPVTSESAIVPMLRLTLKPLEVGSQAGSALVSSTMLHDGHKRFERRIEYRLTQPNGEDGTPCTKSEPISCASRS